MGSFKGNNFRERYENNRLPRPTGGSFKVTHHFPGSDNNHTDLLGKDVQYVTVLGEGTAAEYAAIFNDRGESGTLVFSLGSQTAILDDISEASIIDLGNNRVEFKMNFTI